jgi:hypothetical protein
MFPRASSSGTHQEPVRTAGRNSSGDLRQGGMVHGLDRANPALTLWEHRPRRPGRQHDRGWKAAMVAEGLAPRSVNTYLSLLGGPS